MRQALACICRAAMCISDISNHRDVQTQRRGWLGQGFLACFMRLSSLSAPQPPLSKAPGDMTRSQMLSLAEMRTAAEVSRPAGVMSSFRGLDRIIQHSRPISLSEPLILSDDPAGAREGLYDVTPITVNHVVEPHPPSASSKASSGGV